MNYKKKVLKNGLRIITVLDKNSPTSTVYCLVETGSKYEVKKQNGISHFLEHMCFKGTKTRSRDQIFFELDSIGASNNAFTSMEYTGYYAKAHFKHTNKILDVVSDIYLNSTFPEGEMEKEKGVVVEEIKMYEDLPQRKINDVLTALLYGKNQPAGWSIAGTPEKVKSTKREHLVDYYKDHYVPSATTVVVAG
ncbi:MAG: pitrilysin family protein, partial [Patescibacteria group bacterium]